MEKEALKKYNPILDRSFKRDLDIFLFEKLVKEGLTKDQQLKEEYKSYLSDKEIEEKYLSALQLSKDNDVIEYKEKRYTMKEIDGFLIQWHDNNKNELHAYKNIFKEKHFISEQDFEEFYGTEKGKRECFYCSINELEIEKLIKSNKIHTKRLSTRGKTLEIDRKKPHGKYEKGNMVFCCYWCNNAKTDEFSVDEFRPIGHLIKEIWKERLKDH
jgi:hypothetical protein